MTTPANIVTTDIRSSLYCNHYQEKLVERLRKMLFNIVKHRHLHLFPLMDNHSFSARKMKKNRKMIFNEEILGNLMLKKSAPRPSFKKVKLLNMQKDTIVEILSILQCQKILEGIRIRLENHHKN